MAEQLKSHPVELVFTMHLALGSFAMRHEIYALK